MTILATVLLLLTIQQSSGASAHLDHTGSLHYGQLIISNNQNQVLRVISRLSSQEWKSELKLLQRASI